MITSPALRYHGAKWRVYREFLQPFLQIPHTRYVEPFGGGASVLLQKEHVAGEVYNDLDGDIVNFFRVLQDPSSRERLAELLVLTPYSRDEFVLAYEETDDQIEQARRTVVRSTMGFGSAGATKASTGFRSDSRRSYGTAAHTWSRYPEVIASIGKRLAGVIIENRPAIDVLQAHDDAETLHYIDPPYVMSTRVRGRVGKGRYYRHEMTDDEHRDLSECLHSLEGSIVLSGYRSDLYDELFAGWIRHETTARIAAGRGTGIRTECVWLNASANRGQVQGRFDYDQFNRQSGT